MCKLQKQQFKCNMQPSSSRNHSEDTDREDLSGWNELVAVPNHPAMSTVPDVVDFGMPFLNSVKG
jgi:hypothetical protein